jgi:hypothetical protein
MVDVHWQYHIFDQRQRCHQLEELEDNPQITAAPGDHLLLVISVQGCIANGDFAGNRPINAGEYVDQRRLATARLTDDRDKKVPGRFFLPGTYPITLSLGIL